MLALLAANPALAAIVRVDFSGTTNYGSTVPIGGSIVPGTPFSGYFTFDDAAAPASEQHEEPGATGWAWYEISAPDFAFHTEVGDITTDLVPNPNFPSPMGGYFVFIDDAELEENQFNPSSVWMDMGVGQYPSESGAPWVVTNVTVALGGATNGLPLHSTALGSVPWSASAFPITSVQWYINYGNGGSIEGHIEEFTVSVPEPANGALAALAALALTGLGIARARS